MTKDNKPKRLIIYTKDVMRITGKGRSATRTLIKKIKSDLNKSEGYQLTIFDLCQHQGLTVEHVNLFL